MFPCRKQNFFYLLLIFAPSFFFFWEQELFSIFQLSFYFFGLLCFSRFSFSVYFSGVFHLFFFFFNLSKQKIFSTKALSRKKIFWNTFSFELFLRKEHILIQKRMCSNMIIRIFFKQNLPSKKNLFQDSHALRIPCAIESPLDHCCVSWRTWASKVYVHSVVIDLGRGHLLHQAISHTDSAFLFFINKKAMWKNVMQMSFFTLLFSFQFSEHFSDFFASIVLQNQKFHGRIFIFSSFHFLVFILMFPFLFCLSLCFCQGDLIAEDKHITKRNEWKQPRRMSWLMIFLGLAAIVCFLWLSDLCVTQTARGTPASECWSSSPYVLSLSPHSYSPHVYPPSSTRGKKLLERLGNSRRWGWS